MNIRTTIKLEELNKVMKFYKIGLYIASILLFIVGLLNYLEGHLSINLFLYVSGMCFIIGWLGVVISTFRRIIKAIIHD